VHSFSSASPAPPAIPVLIRALNHCGAARNRPPARSTPMKTASNSAPGSKHRSRGAVVGLRYWRTPENQGPHVGTLWSGGGRRLATVAFTSESSSGWQTARFASPVAVSTGSWYVVSYHAPHGRFFTTEGYSAPSHSRALAVTIGMSGVYAYGDKPSFPTHVWHSSQYWVDVLFRRRRPESFHGAAGLHHRDTGRVAAGPTTQPLPPFRDRRAVPR
jgi:Domain of unknown function (DUF4082)